MVNSYMTLQRNATFMLVLSIELQLPLCSAFINRKCLWNVQKHKKFSMLFDMILWHKSDEL